MDFNNLLAGQGWTASSNLCIVTTTRHGSKSEGEPCEGDPAASTVLGATADFISSQLPP